MENPKPTPRLLLFLSLILNVTLVLLCASEYRRPEAPASTPSPDNATPASSRKLTTDTDRLAVQPQSTARWAKLESRDPAVYAANLRAAGCPPKTARNILLPLIEEKFASPEPPDPETTNSWASFSQRQAASAALTEQKAALRQAKDKLVKELLDYAWSLDGIKQTYAGESAGPVGFLDYDRAEKVLCIADRLKHQLARAEQSHRTERRSPAYQAWRQEVSEVLSPAEFEEAELRGIVMVFQRRNPNLCTAGLSGPELRQLMLYRRELCNPLPTALLAGADDLVHEPELSGEQQFQTKARSLLGDTRFIDYLKSCDASIDRTVAALEQKHLSRSVALQLFDLRQDAIARAQEIRQRPVRRGEKRADLAALHQSAVEQIAGLSNGAADSSLVRFNQDWLQEIANP